MTYLVSTVDTDGISSYSAEYAPMHYMLLQFSSSIHTDMTQVVEIISHGRQERTCLM